MEDYDTARGVQTDGKQGNRKISITPEALFVLREGLIQNIGLERIKGFLVRFGWNLGLVDAEDAKKAYRCKQF